MTSTNTIAARGWSLGSPIGMNDRRRYDWDEATLCGCSAKEPFLHSLVMISVHWPGPVMRAERSKSMVQAKQGLYLVDTHDVDGQNGIVGVGGGLYSYKPQFAERMGGWNEIEVLGIVTLFDTIIEHQRGYRSNGCVVERLWVLWRRDVADRFRRETILDHLATTYHCPVTIVDTDRIESFAEWVMKEDIENLVRAP